MNDLTVCHPRIVSRVEDMARRYGTKMCSMHVFRGLHSLPVMSEEARAVGCAPSSIVIVIILSPLQVNLKGKRKGR